MTNWPTVKLGEVCEFLNGGTPTKSNQDFFVGEIPWITGADIIGSTANSARSFITEEAIKKSATNKVEAGTVLLVTRTSVGKVAIAGMDLCFSQDITAIQTTEQLDKPFLVHFLRTKTGYFKDAARGATIQGITRQVVADLEIPLPPLAQQRRLASILDRADQVRRLRVQTLERLDELVAALFLDSFGDPATNPKGWPMRKLGDLGELDRGISKHRPRDEPRLFGGPYPFIQTGDVANSGGYIRYFSRAYSEEGLKQSKLWPAGTLCITIAANIAKTGMLTFDCCFPDSVVGFKSSSATTEFVRVWFSFVQKHLEDLAPESAQKNINLKILREFPIMSPPLELQLQFAARVEAIESIKTRAREALVESQALFASLQERAFAGEL